MDQEKIDELIATADKRAVYINQVEHAKERFRSLNVMYWEGHVFELSQGFLSFVFIKYMEHLTTQEKIHPVDGSDIQPTPVIFLDKNDEPVLIEDMTAFVETLEEAHTEALNDYYDTYSRLRLARSAEELIEVA